jgi:filamentous hemagglutinin
MLKRHPLHLQIERYINAATNSNNSVQTTKFKQTGITLAVTSPVISAIQTAQQMVQAASQIKDARMQALATGTTALSASNALDAIKAGQGDQFGNIATAGNTGADDMTHVREANGADQVGGINISISLGTSQNSSTTTQTSNNAQSSHVTAGNNINIKATGDQLADGSSNPDSGNINVIGSQVKAAHNVTLKAEDTINLHAAQNVDTLNSKNSGSSASLGVSFGTDGLLFTAGLSGSKGKAKGNDITYTETQIQSGNKTGDSVTLNSGKDTNLIGAQVTGNQVIANVGTNPLTGEAGQGNLNIQSLQDLSDFNSKQQSIGGSISVGYGKMGGSFNYSDSKTNSNYASVKEQSGIMAGDGGFQVNVNGNTDLKGAVIASSQAAIDNHKNSLTTQTLTTSNIENKADYKSSSTSIGGGYSTSGDGVGLSQDGKAQTGGTKVPGTTLPSLGGFSASLPVAMKASGNANSTTLSGISGSNISITNNQAQTALTGKDAIMTVASLNRDVKVVQSTDANGNTTTKTVDSQGNSTAHNLTPIYTEETKAQIEAGFEIIGAFTQQAGTFLNNRAKESTDAQKTIDAENKAAKAEGREPDDTLLSQQQQVLDNNATWSMGSTGRIALTAITAAFSGNVTGSGANLMQAATINTLQALGAQEIKALATQLGGEGSPAHTALHAVLACAGAAATGSDCGTGALAASSGVVINTLLNTVEGKEADKLTASEKEARLNLITSLVTGVTAALGGDAAVANTAVTIETENNALCATSKCLWDNAQLQVGETWIKFAKQYAEADVVVASLLLAPEVGVAAVKYIKAALAACTGNLVLCANQAAIEATNFIEGAPITTATTATIATGATSKAAQEIKVAAEELKEVVRVVRTAESVKGAMPTLPTGMTSPEFGALTGWGKKSQGAWDKLAIGYSNAEIQALKDAGVTRENVESWKVTYETMAKLTAGNPQDTPVPRAKLMQLILERW